MKKKIVCIGNSIVNGFPRRRSQCFASLLRETTGWEIINKGNNGETTTQILARFERDVISHHPDIVVILTGTNDFIFQDATPEEAFQNLIHMANTAALRGIRPIFMTPLPVDEPMATERWMQRYGISYARVNEELRAFAALVRNSGTKYLDLNRLYPECGQYIDGIHPTAAGHRFIAGEQESQQSMQQRPGSLFRLFSGHHFPARKKAQGRRPPGSQKTGSLLVLLCAPGHAT